MGGQAQPTVEVTATEKTVTETVEVKDAPETDSE